MGRILTPTGVRVCSPGRPVEAARPRWGILGMWSFMYWFATPSGVEAASQLVSPPPPLTGWTRMDRGSLSQDDAAEAAGRRRIILGKLHKSRQGRRVIAPGAAHSRRRGPARGPRRSPSHFPVLCVLLPIRIATHRQPIARGSEEYESQRTVVFRCQYKINKTCHSGGICLAFLVDTCESLMQVIEEVSGADGAQSRGNVWEARIPARPPARLRTGCRAVQSGSVHQHRVTPPARTSRARGLTLALVGGPPKPRWRAWLKRRHARCDNHPPLHPANAERH
jgi:hypothetical protein